MRVIAGTARRLRLVTPDGMDTRPTQDIIKETLFNILMPYIPGSVFLDLCAGSGQIGIEALSRGARKAYFVESGRAAAACIQKNLHTTHFEETGILLKQDVIGALRHIHEKEADLIYMDPPYESDTALRILSALAEQPYVTDDTIIIIETSLDSDLEGAAAYGFEIYREKDYRTSRHLFLRKIRNDSEADTAQEGEEQ